MIRISISYRYLSIIISIIKLVVSENGNLMTILFSCQSDNQNDISVKRLNLYQTQ